MLPNNIPDYLKERKQWVLWRWECKEGSEKLTKVPKQPNGYNAATTKPWTWSSFARCYAAYERGTFDGLGFCFAEGDNLVGIDLDKCLEYVDGHCVLSDWASEITLQFMDTWTELTPSGRGLHMWCHGISRSTFKKEPGIEVYDYTSPRYFTVTGQAFNRHPIRNMQSEIDWLVDKYAPLVMLPEKRIYVARNRTEEDVKDALSFIPADDYSTWINVGMALKEGGYSWELWDWWSQRSKHYEPNVCLFRWKGLNPQRITMGKVFYLAKENGWHGRREERSA